MIDTRKPSRGSTDAQIFETQDGMSLMITYLEVVPVN